MIEYDNLENQSIFKSINTDILTEISNINWKDKTYIKQVKYTKENFNPILTTNKIHNFISIYLLNLKYFLAKNLRFIKKTSIGKSLFELGRGK